MPARWEYLVERHTVLSVVAGSRAFGLATSASDTDLRGVYVAPAEAFWRFDKPPTHLDGPRPEQFSWEVERFCALALAGNPTALEALHSPLVERRTPVGAELLALAPAFLSRRVYRTFGDHARSQFRRAEKRRGRGVEPRPKQLVHQLRLLLTASALLETGTLDIDVSHHRDRLLAVRRQETGWDEVCRWSESLVERLDRAAARTSLPDAPDTARVEDWLASVRRRSLDHAEEAAP
ncbi:nucleotidyltransferase domain-containing protein [Streptomyces sp. 549]|uniref:nucleotidyltransferase domain-containing protein n=1 Tax=Streptomyces sp. 549 TaxID=3049076 RepID=UPI0024C2BBA3|nr:nucleotidyltransferase domain-containing protein [Streptomyces sp. 549]MDK1475453.1 nucleotidyltransferase domain-containing protein [Streptomyces sp. 549]